MNKYLYNDEITATLSQVTPLILRGDGETLIFERELVGKNRTITILEKLNSEASGLP